METITKVVASLGASDINERLEIQLVDGIIYSFQEQTTEDQVMLDGFGTVVNALGEFIPLPQDWPPLTFRFRHSRQALPYPNRLHDPLASQQ